MKRLFVVFVIVMMLFIIGCQSVSTVNTKLIANGESIFFICDENIISAGIARNENGKYGRDGQDIEKDADINNTAINYSADLMVQLADDTLIIADDIPAEDSRSESDVTDSADGNSGKDTSLQPEQNTADIESDNVLIPSIPPNNENNTSLVTQPPSRKEYIYQDSTPTVHSINKNKTNDPSDAQPALQKEQSPQEPASDIPSNNENETHVSSDSQPVPPEEQSPQDPAVDIPSDNENQTHVPSDSQLVPPEEQSPQDPAVYIPSDNENQTHVPSDSQPVPPEEQSPQDPAADTPANNEPSPSEPSFQIQIDSSNTLISYTGTAAHADLTGEVILSVGSNAFKDNKYIKTVQLPDSVTDIGERAFEGCSNLTTLQLPRSVRKIHDYAFKDSGLSGCISFYAANVSIGSSAFENTHIEKIVLDPSVKTELTISPYAFANCSKLNHIEMLNKQSSLVLADNAFYQVNDLNIYLGNPVNRTVKYPKQYSKENLGLAGTLSFPDPKNLPNP